MPIFDITRNDVETFTVVANPTRTFVTSSTGATGSVFVIARRSAVQKSITPSSIFADVAHDDADMANLLTTVQEAGFAARQSSGSFLAKVDSYMNGVNQQTTVAANRSAVDVLRVVPSTRLEPDLLKKLNAKDLLGPWHMPSYSSADWSYVNYQSLNFFTASSVGESYLNYPNIDGGPVHEGYVTGCYSLSGAFTFDFSINPRYQPDQTDGVFHAGTIFHMSSSYALSLISGSAKDHNGRVVGYRLQLQLSHSADIQPSLATHGTYPSDLVFLSDDNALSHNTWHKCAVRWGTQYINDGTGSFVVDGVTRGTFVIPSGTVAPQLFVGTENPAVLIVGNFLDGTNSGSNATAKAFGPTRTTNFGVKQLWSSDPLVAPTYSSTHQLNAELHDLSIWRKYRSDAELAVSGAQAPTSFGTDVALYVPPFFKQASPIRRSLSGSAAGVMLSPYVTCDGTTEDPVNTLLRLSSDGHLVNIENFVCDLANDNTPFAHGAVFESAVTVTGSNSANDTLYRDSRVCRRNLMILPCDDGNWIPEYSLIGVCLTGSRHADSLGRNDSSLVSLVDLASTGSLLLGAAPDEASGSQDAMIVDMLGITPETFSVAAGSVLTSKFAALTNALDTNSFVPALMRDIPTAVYQRTRDDSAAAIMFDVSSIFYGARILPGSFVLSESETTGSAGACHMTLRDDGHGGIYRADAASAWATWASVGTVFYDEGLIVLRNPHLALFGKDGFSMSFKGERRLHVMRIDALAPANQLNSSSNPAYVSLHPSGYANESDSSFVYITGINFHDENLNVVARTQLAQPVLKRFGDRIMFKVKLDW